MRTLLLTLAAALLLPLGADTLRPREAAAQTPSGTPAPTTEDEDFRRFSLDIATVRPLAGSPNAIHDLFVERGFDDAQTFGCLLFCVGPQERPSVADGARETMVSARYRLDRRWSAAAFLTGRTVPVTTEGFRRPSYDLELQHGVSTWALAAGYRVHPNVDVSVGPALYRVTLERFHVGPDESWSATKLGLFLDGGVELPADGRFFIRLFGQYRWVPSTRFGPLRVESAPFNDAPSITFEAFDLDSSQLVLGVGGGIRF